MKIAHKSTVRTAEYLLCQTFNELDSGQEFFVTQTPGVKERISVQPFPGVGALFNVSS